VAGRVRIPVIGVGGISTAADVVEYLIAGARAVEVGTANFVDPEVTVKIIQDLELYCQKKEISKLEDIIGSLRVEEAKEKE
ncbi:MAG: nitronate monooxygenase, partial [Candidatus Aminicenantales bacterium]